MKKFIQNSTNISWALFLLLSFFLLCGEKPIGADPDLERYNAETQIIWGGWAISLIAATLLSCFQFMAWCRGKGKPEHF